VELARRWRECVLSAREGAWASGSLSASITGFIGADGRRSNLVQPVMCRSPVDPFPVHHASDNEIPSSRKNAAIPCAIAFAFTE
jgi:hypothetical protein